MFFGNSGFNTVARTLLMVWRKGSPIEEVSLPPLSSSMDERSMLIALIVLVAANSSDIFLA